MMQKYFFDQARGQVKGRFHELKQPGQNDPPRHLLCSIEEYEFRPTGKRRSEKEKANFLVQKYESKLAEIREKAELKTREEKSRAKGPSIKLLMQQWIDNEVSPTCKPITAREYTRTCHLYIDLVGDHLIRDFKKHHATSFQTGLKAHGLSEAGIRKHQTQLGVFLNWAYSEEHLEKPVKLKKIRTVQKGPVIYSRDDLEKLHRGIGKAINDAPSEYKKRCAENHLRVFMAFRHAILRSGEILSLPLRNILIEDEEILITEVPEIGWKPKNRQERIIPMNPELREFLQDDLKNRINDEFWYLDDGTGSQAYSSNSQVSQAMRRNLKRLGLDRPGLKPLHSGRSAGITGMLASGGKLDFVMRIAGHSNPKVTLDHYVRPENYDLRDTVGLLSTEPGNNGL